MENNKENRARFFAQYFGQEVATISIVSDRKTGMEKLQNGSVGLGFANLESKIIKFITLTPLSQISDEDAIKLAMIIYGHLNNKIYHNVATGKGLVSRFFKREVVFYPILVNEAIDYLRSRGYALPFLGLSVEQLVQYGWVKLKGGSDG